MVSLLGLIFDIVELDSSEWYSGDYNYWTVRESDGKNLFLSYRTSSELILGVPDSEWSRVSAYVPCLDAVSLEDEPVFIPYRELEFYLSVSLDIKRPVWYDTVTKYPRIMVSGSCCRTCGNRDISLYCFNGFPCDGRNPIADCYTGKYPNFFDFIFDIANWIRECGSLTVAVYVYQFWCLNEENTSLEDYDLKVVVNDNLIIVGE